MRVGAIAYAFDRPSGGIGRYSRELVRALAVLPDEPGLTLLAAGGVGSLTRPSGVRQLTMRGCGLLPGLVTLGNVAVPRVARRLRLDIVHDPTGVTPFLFGAGEAKTVVTVHDVFAWSCPGNSTLLDTLIYRYWLPGILPRVDAVITDSQASKADIVRYLKVNPAKITVIPLAADAAYRPVGEREVARVCEAYGLPEGYLLYVGSVTRRKNLCHLLQGYAQLKEIGLRHPLVVVGASGWRSTEVARTVEALDLKDTVVFTGYVPDADLPALYTGAELFVFPSLYEGFGLPPLEAMACGTPVITSNVSSLPEVVGDAALTVDPYDVEVIAEAMRQILTDADLREGMRQRGLERAKQFSWERTARETVDVYRKVLGQSNR